MVVVIQTVVTMHTCCAVSLLEGSTTSSLRMRSLASSVMSFQFSGWNSYLPTNQRHNSDNNADMLCATALDESLG